ncbi:MAG: VanW family protein [Polyangiaceae bacterium]|nr:VanW family protein [Polyangiaceae bacterium]
MTHTAQASARARVSRRVALSLIGVVALAAGCLLAWLCDRALAAGRIQRGIWIRELALSGMTTSDARGALSGLQGRLRTSPVAVRLGERLFQLVPESVDVVVDVEPTLAHALSRGRDGSWARQLGWWLSRWYRGDLVAPTLRLDRSRLDQVLRAWEKAALGDLPFDGNVRFEQNQLLPEYPRAGLAVDRHQAERAILGAIARGDGLLVELVVRQHVPRLSRADVDDALTRAIELTGRPVRLSSDDPELFLELGPQQLGTALETEVIETRGHVELEFGFDPRAVARLLASLRDKGLLEPKSASFAVDHHDRVSVVPGRDGRELDPARVAAALRDAALSESRTGRLPVTAGARAALTTEDAEALQIRGLVAGFSTRHPCCRPRVGNIHRIADLINGLVVRPGETFSVNAVVGERTVKSGFVPAPSIEDGEIVDSVGGGVSQFATTLFNAVLRAGYAVVERTPHTYYFDRYPMGYDATLGWPKPDLVFRNDTEAGLLIKTFYSKTEILVKLYGDSGGRRVTTHVSAPQDVVEPPIELVTDPELEVDEADVVDQGRIGWSVMAVRRITFPDGTQREDRRRVTYNPQTRVVGVHPCRIPEGHKAYTGEKCPEVEESEEGDGGAGVGETDGGTAAPGDGGVAGLPR